MSNAHPNYAAIRALRTAQLRSPRLQAQYEGWMADRHYDAGEWSDPAHGEFLTNLERDIAAKVAARFNMSAEDLITQAMVAAYEEFDITIDPQHPQRVAAQVASEAAELLEYWAKERIR